MADSFIQVPPDSTGKLLDASSLTVGANTVQRERINIADPTVAANIATVTPAGALKVDNSAVTQPVSGTFFQATQPVSLASAVDVSDRVARLLGVAKIVDTGGTNQLAVTAANAAKVDGSAVTQPVSLAAAVDVSDRSGRLLGVVASITAAVDVSDRAARLVGQIEGRAASGAAKVGNPNQVGGVFNTTQPTVTTGQVVEVQATARGALIVATGVDIFTVVANAGTGNFNIIGTQSDNSTNSTAKLPVIAARANAAAPAWTESNEVPLAVDLTGTARVGAGVASTVNSSTALLGINGVFTGTFEEVRNFSAVALSVIADVASAVSGLAFQWSSDGTNVDRTESSSVLANTGRAFSLSTRARYFRVQYTNGGTAQATFRLQSTYLAHGSGVITKPLSGAVTDDNFAQSVQASVAGRQSTGTFLNIAATPASTAAAAADPALVVGLSPNSPLPTGSNVIGALSANQSVNLAQVGGTATVTGGVAGTQGVGGLAASGAAKVGNPNQVGGVFNTTQPTVATGQVVEAQATARGALIVATGVDTFAANATLSAETTKVIGTVRVQGNVGGVFDAATAAAVPANAVQVGGRAAVANPTAVTVGQLAGLMTDILGKMVVRAEAPRERVVQNTITLTATTETTLIAAGAAGVFRDLTSLTFANTSATGVRVDIRDATAGTVRFSFWLPPTDTRGIDKHVPIAQTTAANNWTAQLSAAVTDVRIFAQAIETA